MDIKVNQINQVTQPEAAAPVRESDGNFKFTLVSHVEEQELQTRLTSLMEEITMQGDKLAKKRYETIPGAYQGIYERDH